MTLFRIPFFRPRLGLIVASTMVLLACGGGSDEPAAPPADGPKEISLLLGDGASWGNLDGAAHEARFGKTLSVAAGRDGSVIVADHENRSIRHVDRAGTVNTLHRLDGNRFLSLWVDPQAGQPFVIQDMETDSRSGYQSRLVTWEADGSATVLATLGQAGAPFARTPDGETLVYDRQSSTLVKLLANGQRQQMTEPFHPPLALTLDRTGNVYILDPFELRRLSPNGNLERWRLPGGTSGTRSLAVDAQNQLWLGVSEHHTGTGALARYRALRFRPDGGFEMVDPQGPEIDLNSTPSLAVTSDARLVIASNGAITQRADGRWSLLAGSTAPVRQEGFISGGFDSRKFNRVGVSDHGQIVFDGQAYDTRGQSQGTGSVPFLLAYSCFRTVIGEMPGGIGRVVGLTQADIVRLPVTMPNNELFCPWAAWETRTGRVFFAHRAGGFPFGKETVLYERLRNGTAKRLLSLDDLYVSSMIATQDDKLLYVVAGNGKVPTSRSQVLRVDLTNATVTALGSLTETEAKVVDGAADEVRFAEATLHAVDAAGHVYLTDSPLGADLPRNTVIRRISPSGETSTLAGNLDLYGYRAGMVPGTLPPIDSLALDVRGVLYAASGDSVIRIGAK